MIIAPIQRLFDPVKPSDFADLRPVVPVVREDLRNAGDPDQAVRCRVQNRSQDTPIEDVIFRDVIPDGVGLGALPAQCTL